MVDRDITSQPHRVNEQAISAFERLVDQPRATAELIHRLEPDALLRLQHHLVEAVRVLDEERGRHSEVLPLSDSKELTLQQRRLRPFVKGDVTAIDIATHADRIATALLSYYTVTSTKGRRIDYVSALTMFLRGETYETIAASHSSTPQSIRVTIKHLFNTLDGLVPPTFDLSTALGADIME